MIGIANDERHGRWVLRRMASRVMGTWAMGPLKMGAADDGCRGQWSQWWGRGRWALRVQWVPRRMASWAMGRRRIGSADNTATYNGVADDVVADDIVTTASLLTTTAPRRRDG